MRLLASHSIACIWSRSPEPTNWSKRAWLVPFTAWNALAWASQIVSFCCLFVPNIALKTLVAKCVFLAWALCESAAGPAQRGDKRFREFIGCVWQGPCGFAEQRVWLREQALWSGMSKWCDRTAHVWHSVTFVAQIVHFFAWLGRLNTKILTIWKGVAFNSKSNI